MRFYLNRSGQNEGPLEEAAIAQMIQRGEVPPTAYICPEGGSAWQPLSSHPPFAAPKAPAAPAVAQKPIAATMAMDSAMIQAAARSSAAGLGMSPVAGMQPMSPAPMAQRPPQSSSPQGFSPQGFSPQGFSPQPQGGFAQGGFSPSPTGPAAFTPPQHQHMGGMQMQPAKKGMNLPLIIGGGCAVLFLLSFCAVMGLFIIR
jgi:hypothetical protein